MTLRALASIAAAWSLVCVAVSGAWAQSLPAPDPASAQQNIYYGEVPPGHAQAPVLVFVHGVNGRASDWWSPQNDMYLLAFAAGYRTAFVGLSVNGTPNNEGILPNALVLQAALPAIITDFATDSVYIIAHSKGGIDVQGAMLDAAFSSHVKAVFTIATPHEGTELADWAFGAGQAAATGLGLLSPAVNALRISNMAQFRQLADPASLLAGVPYYTISGSSFSGPPNALTSATGPVLQALTNGQANDGIVTVARSRLPSTYAHELGSIAANHFAISAGGLVFPRINAQIRALEGTSEFRALATGGFAFDGNGAPLEGDRQNSFPWSMQWFKGKLYVGTGRAFACVGAATSDAASGTHHYPPADPRLECTPDPRDLPLRAEIWRYTPETRTWDRVYQSPQDVPIEFDADGHPLRFTARDIAFRGMAVFEENRRRPSAHHADDRHRGESPGEHANNPVTERLYVGGLSASSLFDTLPAYGDPGVRRYPPPRMLWTEDGTSWHEVPQTPGTFFGDIGIQTEAVNKRGFRSFASLRDANGVNRLFVTLSDATGIGRVLMSAQPSAGNNAWRQVSPSADLLPIFTIHAYRGQLYATATLGGVAAPHGYGIFRTDTVTPDPLDPMRLHFTPVVLPTEGLQYPPRTAISMQEFQGRLYVGSDRPTELIRINPDDSWDLLIGAPRLTSSGFKRPLSGIGTGFNSLFNGHFYTMVAHAGELYLGTWDWSDILQGSYLDGIVKRGYGFDLFKTRDGISWNVVSRNGLGDPSNAIVRNMTSTPVGLFAGVANLPDGLQIFQNASVLDFNHDGVIDSKDVEVITDARNSRTKTPHDPRDLDRDGRITQKDARMLETQCTNPGCAAGTSTAVARAPGSLVVRTGNAKTMLSWTAAPGVVRYHVYRSDAVMLEDFLPPGTTVSLPGGETVTLEDIRNGALDALCQSDVGETTLCGLVEALRTTTLMMQPPHWIGSTTGLTLVDRTQPPLGQAFYYSAAEDGSGHIGAPSNIVVAGSRADVPSTRR